jgi:hypothetical protein
MLCSTGLTVHCLLQITIPQHHMHALRAATAQRPSSDDPAAESEQQQMAHLQGEEQQRRQQHRQRERQTLSEQLEVQV